MIDLTKPVRTKKGLAAVILATDIKNSLYPVAARVTEESGNEVVMAYSFDGKYFAKSNYSSGYDLENIPEEPKEWINVYGGDRIACTHMEKDRALNACKLPNGKYGKDYVCTLEITRINGLVSKVDTIQINWENSNAR